MLINFIPILGYIFFIFVFFSYHNPFHSELFSGLSNFLNYYLSVYWIYFLGSIYSIIYLIEIRLRKQISIKHVQIVSFVFFILLLVVNILNKNGHLIFLSNWKFFIEILWFFSTIGFILSSSSYFIDIKLSNKYQQKWLLILFAVVLIMIAIAIRLYRLGDLSFWWDERISADNIKNIINYGLPKAPDQFDYYWRGIFYHYFSNIFVVIGGFNEWWVRFPSVLCGLGIIGSSSYIAYKINPKLFWYVLFFEVFSTYNIEYSRFARFYILNSFLFLLAILATYKGFFQNHDLFKTLSIVLYLLMIYTVQIGQFFIVIYFAYLLIDIYRSCVVDKISLKKYFVKKYIDWLLFIILLAVAYFGNLLIVLLTKTADYAYLLDSSIPTPRSYSFLSMPKWAFSSWINNNLYFFSIIIISYFIWFRQIIKKRADYFSSFIFLIIAESIILLETINRGVFSPRILLFLAPLLDVMIIWCINILYQRTYQARFFIPLTILFVWLGIKPYFWNVVNANYGDDVSQDVFRSTNVAIIRTDEKNQYEYLNGKYDPKNDIWIATTTGSAYVDFRPDYIIYQNYRWNTYSFIDEYGNYHDQYGSILINNIEKIQKIISANQGKNIFITVNGSDIDLLNTTHLSMDFIDYINENSNKTVFVSEDGLSKVLLFH